MVGFLWKVPSDPSKMGLNPPPKKKKHKQGSTSKQKLEEPQKLPPEMAVAQKWYTQMGKRAAFWVGLLTCPKDLVIQGDRSPLET